jgi:hypothetical protein
MSSDTNKKAGPTTLWKTLKGKDVKTNDGNDLGEIKEISDNYMHVQKGTIHKESFWIPKYVADAFDGKTLWLLIDEEELRSRYQYGKDSIPSTDQYGKDFEKFKGTPFGQKGSYDAEFNTNIRVIENYKNIRDLK